MEEIEERKRKALLGLIKDLELKVKNGWYGKISVDMKKGKVEKADFTDTKVY